MAKTQPGLLEVTVKKVLGSGRLGRPAAVRWLVRYTGRPTEAVGRLAAAQRAVERWFGGRPSGAHVAGDKTRGHLTATFAWKTGETAVITVTPGGGVQADDLVVLGSRGALHYETPPLHGGPEGAR